jgi:hypothetical protein
MKTVYEGLFCEAVVGFPAHMSPEAGSRFTSIFCGETLLVVGRDDEIWLIEKDYKNRAGWTLEKPYPTISLCDPDIVTKIRAFLECCLGPPEKLTVLEQEA